MLLVEPAALRRRLDHRVLARDVVRADRNVERVARGADHVEVRQRRLDHDRVGALLEIELALAQRLAHVRGIHLVAAAVAERRRRVGRLAERAEERGRVLRGVREDRRRLEAAVVERVADRAHAAVHHVARRNDVRARLDVRHRRAREQLERRVVRHLAVDDHAAVSVRRVLAETHVGHQHQLGEARPQRAQRLLHDSVLLPRAGRLLVLLRRDAEQDHRLDAEPHQLLDLAEDAVDGVARHPRQVLVAQRLGRDEQRHDERLEIEPRLAHEPAQRRGAAEPAKPDVGVRAHAERLRLRRRAVAWPTAPASRRRARARPARASRSRSSATGRCRRGPRRTSARHGRTAGTG